MNDYANATWEVEEAHDPTAWNTNLTGLGFVLDDILGAVEHGSHGPVTGTNILASFYPQAGNETLLGQQKDDFAAERKEKGELKLPLIYQLIFLLFCLLLQVRPLGSGMCSQ